MTEEILKIYLPGFIIVFIWVTILWRSFTRLSGIQKIARSEQKIYNRLKRIHFVYRFILIVFSIMIMLFSFLPDAYKWLFPIPSLNKPLINLTGFLILKVALVWVAVAQILLDKEISKYARNIENLTSMEMVYLAERTFLKGLIIMFIGMFVTLSNVLAIILVILALSIYFKSQLVNHSNNNNFRR